jgi:hypothetical protein
LGSRDDLDRLPRLSVERRRDRPRPQAYPGQPWATSKLQNAPLPEARGPSVGGACISRRFLARSSGFGVPGTGAFPLNDTKHHRKQGCERDASSTHVFLYQRCAAWCSTKDGATCVAYVAERGESIGGAVPQPKARFLHRCPSLTRQVVRALLGHPQQPREPVRPDALWVVVEHVERARILRPGQVLGLR